MGAPRVSVVMPVFNAEAFLDEAVRSVLDQTWRDLELVVVDDGSTDGSKAILDRFAAGDERVRIVSRPNTGVTGALNDGVAAVRGELIARMDADDIAHVDRLDEQVRYLDAHAGCAVVGTAWRYLHPDGRRVELDEATLRTLAGGHDAILAELLNGHNVLAHPTVMFRRAVYERAGGTYYDPQYETAEDMELWLRMSEHGTLDALDRVLLEYRVHPQSICSQRGVESIGTVVRAVRAALRRRGESRMSAMAPVYLHSARVSLAVGRRGMAWRYAARACAAAPRRRDPWRWIAQSLLGRLRP